MQLGKLYSGSPMLANQDVQRLYPIHELDLRLKVVSPEHVTPSCRMAGLFYFCVKNSASVPRPMWVIYQRPLVGLKLSLSIVQTPPHPLHVLWNKRCRMSFRSLLKRSIQCRT